MGDSNGSPPIVSPPLTPQSERTAPTRIISPGARSLVESCQWFHGKMTRSQAEEVLRQNGGRNGQFLVRESGSSHGDFAISVVHNGSVVHYQVRRHGGDAFFSAGEAGPIIHGLEELIRYYEQPGQAGLVCSLQEMCKGQAPPHDTRRHGRTNLLHRATKSCNLSVVRELLQSDYNIDAKNQDGQTALHLACLEGEPKIALELLDRGASPNCLDGKGHTPLHYACREGYFHCVQHLLDHGASMTIYSLGSRWAPLHFAAYRGDEDIVRLLLDEGAPVRPRTKGEELPKDLVYRGQPELRPSLTKLLTERMDPVYQGYHREEWFHGSLLREEANALLEGSSDGAFLIRTSRRPGVPENTTVLSMAYNGEGKHFAVSRRNRFHFIDDGPFFDSLEALIEHYSRHNDGLPCTLRAPVRPVVGPVVSSSLPGWRTSLHAPLTPTAGASPNEPTRQFENASIIAREKLKLKENIGGGEFGSVYSGVWDSRSGSTQVAVKTLREEHSTPEKWKGFVHEVNMMLGLAHPCIVKLIGVCLGPPLMMVQELVELGSLIRYLQEQADTIEVQVDFPRWSQQIASGMSYLESRQLVHRDLAARNILLASRMQAKISDFGLSRAVQINDNNYHASTGGKWPLKWYAPEAVNFGSFSTASDVWSFGVTLWEMYSFGAEQPYGSMTGIQVLNFVETGSRLDQPIACPDWCYEIMLRCWSIEKDARPCFGDLAQMFAEQIPLHYIDNVVVV
ncbi:tyrosine-protein kinase HTK16-like isoform X2 [Varroa jacobsoni]|uniref:Tyrosine-protein kinase n=1 Tax=Varroa destructor TaxID=109461 RepID=A0A7M7KDT9_VARDE|nr:tyrosine-protein kinase HTK16-like isoform X2 [Varroa destructor]XP_022690954.1 tyrosine-protein kinase HTK16-like isoform X2 [Varroa jacobsoni]